METREDIIYREQGQWPTWDLIPCLLDFDGRAGFSGERRPTAGGNGGSC